MARRVPLYSASPRATLDIVPSDPRNTKGAAKPGADPRSAGQRRSGAAKRFYRRFERAILLAGGALAATIAVLVYAAVSPAPPRITQGDINAAVLYTIDALPPEPSISSVAYQIIGPSVVRAGRHAIRGDDGGVQQAENEERDLHQEPDEEFGEELGVGTGVVIEDTGIILTALHVVAGAERIVVTFADGFRTDGEIISAQPDNDLAVLQVSVIPEGLPPATLTTTRGLRPGDDVVVVGTPFGIGNSVSAGVISGLERNYFSPDGDAMLTGLIQFDAAANPGNSGGPLVNTNGEVLGIVTSIFNPTEDGVFIGIGFAVPIETAARGAGQNPF